ncbi:MAG TPA: hypothetical protein P5076_21390, partial [Myxococcota bacterium]|nr:hypothetical protein [Myxococcota bacterium]
PGTALVFLARSARADFFETPWPCDARLRPDGRLDLTGFPNPGPSSMLQDILATIEAETVGFGTNQADYLTFDGPLDPAALVDGVFLLDVSDGPGRGERSPVAARFFAQARQFTPENTLVVRPELGFPLREKTTYALVVLRSAGGALGPLGSTSDFERMKLPQQPEDPRLAAWWRVLQPAFAVLDVPASEVAALTVYTTQDVLGEMQRVRDFAAADTAPAASRWAHQTDRTDCYRFEGWFPVPELQAGEPPDFEGGGGFVFDAGGAPVVQRRPEIPFTLTTPKGAPPAAGWPVVIYAHGTGGSRTSFVGEGVGDNLARAGLAVVSIDQPLHGDRNPWGRNEDIVTFNPYNVLAMRDNFRQGALDVLVLRRLLEGLAVPAGVSPTGAALPLDGTRVAFFGHSQGSLNGPIFLAVSRDTAGGVFSGPGGGLGVALLEKVEPVDIRALIVAGLGLVDGEFDLDHPVITVFTAFAERADPLNYGPRLLLDPPAGTPSKHLLFTQGLLDVYAMPAQAAAMAAASGCAPMVPLQQPFAPFTARGVQPLAPPISGNAQGPDGQAYTAVMIQYPEDGHFAVFHNADAMRHYTDFLDSLLHAGAPTVGP